MSAQIARFPVERRRPRPLITMNELCEQTRYSRRFFTDRIREGMPAHCWGRRYRFDPEEVERWLDERYAN